MKMERLSSVKKLGLHDGIFHADDVMCAAMVSFCNPDIEIIRTRDEALLSTCDLVADIGGGYYDHHQENRRTREDGIIYSACGILWDDFAGEVISSITQSEGYTGDYKALVNNTKKTALYDFIEYIDATDNGMTVFEVPEFKAAITLSSMISGYNGDLKDQEANFKKALNFAKLFLESYVIGAITENEGSVALTLLSNSFKTELGQLLASIVGSSDEHEADKLLSENLEIVARRLLDVEIDKEVVPFIKDAVSRDFSDMVNWTEIKRYQLIGNLHIPTADFVCNIISVSPEPVTYTVREYLENWLRKVVTKYDLNTINVIKEAVAQAYKEGKRYIVLDKFVPWSDHLLNLDTENRILFTVFGSDPTFKVQGARLTRTKNTCKCYLPKSWRGKRDEELSQVTGIDGCIFCHPTGFLCGNATKEGAIKMAEKAIEMAGYSTETQTAKTVKSF